MALSELGQPRGDHIETAILCHTCAMAARFGTVLCAGSSPALGIDKVSRRDTLCLSVTRKAKSVGKRPVKHERVIHTRVPVVLEEELKRFADNLRVPISNLIRTILEDALAVADQAGHRVERELRSGVAQLAHGRESLRRKLTRRIPRRKPRR